MERANAALVACRGGEEEVSDKVRRELLGVEDEEGRARHELTKLRENQRATALRYEEQLDDERERCSQLREDIESDLATMRRGKTRVEEMSSMRGEVEQEVQEGMDYLVEVARTVLTMIKGRAGEPPPPGAIPCGACRKTADYTPKYSAIRANNRQGKAQLKEIVASIEREVWDRIKVIGQLLDELPVGALNTLGSRRTHFGDLLHEIEERQIALDKSKRTLSSWTSGRSPSVSARPPGTPRGQGRLSPFQPRQRE